jgi:hypothetical protein
MPRYLKEMVCNYVIYKRTPDVTFRELSLNCQMSSETMWKLRKMLIDTMGKVNKQVFSRSGVEINFSDVNIVTEVEHFLPREQIFANICSLGSFHFFDSCDKNLMGVFIFFDCCDKNLIVLSRQLLIPLNCHHLSSFFYS